ncbi:GLPGLI family protein [Flavobacterium macrobrachii]|uniref:GLPGLI family protein n=1 Tax=Flavobacterium macrobrachii TaxID=591204 RepID=A0ABS2CY30_9FLAO|nr:GLPGLI family protein [Flavobacterium macrobrachii]MBM6499864.1 GLPGLI family protein [Flavobacterium macrobrachii]
MNTNLTKRALAVLLLATSVITAQEFHGKAEYFSKRIMKKVTEQVTEKIEMKNNPELQGLLEEAMKKASEKQYVLIFNKIECLYEEEQKLDKPEANNGMSVTVSFSSAGKKYLNLKDKNSIVEDNIFGKEFLVVEPLVKPEWKLIDETKKIGEYNCFKAELVIPVSEKQKKEYEEFLKKEEKKPALFKIEKPEDKIVTAWYSPEIPVSFGPDNYWGLPGLILEVNDGDNMLLCSKVVLTNKEKTEIKAPTNGKKITQKKFDEILKKKTESMQNEDGVIIFQQ